jgi:hypothetical protein
VRLLSIGRPLPDRSIDNHSIFNAPAAFDYDCIVIDPDGVSTSIHELIDATNEHLTHADVPVVNALTGPGSPAGEILQRRRDELVRALERGALVVVFTHPQTIITELIGFPGLDRYFFLPAPIGIRWDTALIRWGEGSNAAVVDHSNPFSRYVDEVHDDILYRAHFNESLPGFADVANVFSRSTGGAPIGVEFRVLAGKVVFLPAAHSRGGDPGRIQAAAILTAAHEMLNQPSGDPPTWVHNEVVPGLTELHSDLEEASATLERAETQRAATKQEASHLERVRDVLWTEGGHALLPAVIRCAELLGFSTHENDGLFTLTSAEGRLELEVEGSIEAIGMAPHYRLRPRLDERIEKESSPARGLVVANGERLISPPERKEPIAETLRIAAEATSYGVLPAPELFSAARAVLEGLEDEVATTIRIRLFEQDGVTSLSDLLDENTDAT